MGENVPYCSPQLTSLLIQRKQLMEWQLPKKEEKYLISAVTKREPTCQTQTSSLLQEPKTREEILMQNIYHIGNCYARSLGTKEQFVHML